MAGEPIKPNSAGVVASAKAEARRRPVPEGKPSASDDIAAVAARDVAAPTRRQEG
jgi:hypothetical protein